MRCIWQSVAHKKKTSITQWKCILNVILYPQVDQRDLIQHENTRSAVYYMVFYKLACKHNNVRSVYAENWACQPTNRCSYLSEVHVSLASDHHPWKRSPHQLPAGKSDRTAEFSPTSHSLSLPMCIPIIPTFPLQSACTYRVARAIR